MEYSSPPFNKSFSFVVISLPRGKNNTTPEGCQALFSDNKLSDESVDLMRFVIRVSIGRFTDMKRLFFQRQAGLH